MEAGGALRCAIGAAGATLALAAAGCSQVRTACPQGTEIARRIFSGGAEAEWCRRPDDVRQGPEVRYYESGKTMVDGSYMDGAQHGVWRYFFKDGRVWREDRWQDGEVLAKTIDPRVARMQADELEALGMTSSGIIKLAERDPLPRREAEARATAGFTGRYSDGRLQVAGRYDGEGLRTGTWRFWNEAGRLVREIDYDLGVRHRAFREWHENGAPKTDGFYMAGERDGVWRHWDPSSRPTAAEHYDGGRRLTE
jgi:antitoxin component YwqK of YwqJK toxin-antitoxin module